MNRPKSFKAKNGNSISNIDKESSQTSIDYVISQFPLDLQIRGSDNIPEGEIEEVQPQAEFSESVQPELELLENIQSESDSLKSTQSEDSNENWFNHIYDLFKFHTNIKRRNKGQ